MRPAFRLPLYLFAIVALTGCNSGGKSPTVLAPTAEPTPQALPEAQLAPAPQVGLGGIAASGGNVESALAIYTIDLNVQALSASARLKATRAGQDNDDLYLLSIDKFLKADSLKIVSVARGATTIDVTYDFTHPFPAPSNPSGAPNGSTNRADLGIAGMVCFPLDVTATTGNTYFDESGSGGGKVIANTALITNADAYYQPAGLITSSATANTFPYKLLVDESGPGGSRVGVPNNGDSTGNFGADGWTLAEMGGAVPFNGWTGYGVLHQGQSARSTLKLDAVALAAAGSVSFDAVVIAKYNDPRQGTNPGLKRSHRLPPAAPDMSIFGYRMPHGALDVQRIRFDDATGTGFVPNQLSGATLNFHLEDWDARATPTTVANLFEDPDPTTVIPGEEGLPDFAVCIPGVLGDPTVIDDWDPGTDVQADDHGYPGGDMEVDAGRPDDALYYTKVVTKSAGSGQTAGLYTGMARATDPEVLLATSPITPLDGNLTPLTSGLPVPVTYQAFAVPMSSPNSPPTVTVDDPAAPVDSGDGVLTLQVSAYNDPPPNPTPIQIQFDWDDNGNYTGPGESLMTISGATPVSFSAPGFYNNATLTPEVHQVRYQYTDGVIFTPITGIAHFTLGPNQAPKAVGTPGLGLANACLPTPATFSVISTGLTVTDPEGDPISYTVVGTPNTGAAVTSSNIATFPFGGSAAGPWTNPSVSSVAFTGFANDPLHAGITGRPLPTAGTPLTGIITIAGTASFVDTFGGSAGDLSYTIATDAGGNFYIGGYFQGTADFDPGAGVQNRSALAGADLFCLKLDASGSYQWVATWGGDGIWEDVRGISIDSSGNPLIVGRWDGTTEDFDPGPGVVNKTNSGAFGNYECFALKLSSAGTFQWAASWGGTTGNDRAASAAYDPSGNPIITGYFDGTADFDPGAGVQSRTATSGDDTFFLKLNNTTGAYIDVQTLTGTAFDYGETILADGMGNIVVQGAYGGTLDFDPGAGVQNRSAAGSNPFILKLDASTLAYQWVAAIPVNIPVGSTFRQMTLDASGNSYITGEFVGTGDFDAGAGADSRTSNGSSDAYLVSYGPTGTYRWADTLGGASGDLGTATATDGTGVYLGGEFFGANVDFDPGAGTALLSATGATGDAYLLKVNATNGAYVWASRWGGSGVDQVFKMVLSQGCNDPVTTGIFQSTVDFDPGAPVVNRTASGFDSFVLKLVATTGTM